jgi:hypothetical protein
MNPVDYDWAVLRVIPRVHLGASMNVAVIVHARTEGFLDMCAMTEVSALGTRLPGVDAELLSRYLHSAMAICRGEVAPGASHAAIALAPPSERFHWLTAPRSDILQASPVHGGLTQDLTDTLQRLYKEQVLTPWLF